MRELPLNGRSWTDLAQLQPGVNAVHTQAAANTSDRASRGWGAVLTISGARPTQNNYRLNGISLNDSVQRRPRQLPGGESGRGRDRRIFGSDRHFPGGRRGKSSGGVINAIRSPGTNQTHGSAYEFIRNSAVDAKNHFDPAGPIAPFRRNQFGASVGPPNSKGQDVLFRGLRGTALVPVSSSNVVIVPTALARTGVLCAPPDCSTTTTSSVSPNVSPYLPLWPLPNQPRNDLPLHFLLRSWAGRRCRALRVRGSTKHA